MDHDRVHHRKLTTIHQFFFGDDEEGFHTVAAKMPGLALSKMSPNWLIAARCSAGDAPDGLTEVVRFHEESPASSVVPKGAANHRVVQRLYSPGLAGRSLC